MSPQFWEYEGVNRRGTSVAGRTSGPVAEFVEERHTYGWTVLRVYERTTIASGGECARVPGEERRVVGEILTVGAVRQWWAEVELAHDAEGAEQ